MDTPLVSNTNSLLVWLVVVLIALIIPGTSVVVWLILERIDFQKAQKARALLRRKKEMEARRSEFDDDLLNEWEKSINGL